MTSSSICVVFEVEGVKAPLPSSYFVKNAASKDVDQLMQKVLDHYQRHDCSVQVLMGRSIEELTQRAVIPIKELFEPRQNS